jgi:hypothetical protein
MIFVVTHFGTPLKKKLEKKRREKKKYKKMKNVE